MMKLYIASAILGFGLYGYAQYQGWSLFASEAQEYQRARAAGTSHGHGSGYGGSSSGSGHK